MTLDSIIPQLTVECELVISDNASTDKTEQVISKYVRHFKQLRYIKQPQNIGLDRNYNAAVEAAQGEYCWLMTDDDLLKPGAVAAILEQLCGSISLIVVTTEVRDFSLSKILQHRWPNFDSDRVYGSNELDRLFLDLGGALNINAFVIRRQIWLTREKEEYYGSLLIHMGVVFQRPLPDSTRLIAEPLITYRKGNVQTYSTVFSEIVMSKWPSLVESLALSESTKERIYSTCPWKHFGELLLWRARGHFSLAEYRKWIRPRLRSSREALIPMIVALLPGAFINVLFIFRGLLTCRPYRGVWQRELFLYWMKASRYYFRNWPVFRRDTPRDHLDVLSTKPL